jgi:hypothetical protein
MTMRKNILFSSFFIAIFSLISFVPIVAAADVPATTTPQKNSQQASETQRAPVNQGATKKADETQNTSPGKSSKQTETKESESDAVSYWDENVWIPLIRFGGMAVIIGALMWVLNLPSVLGKEVWTERTIIAFAIVFTYCASALMGAMDVLATLKDVALLTLGFYFGSAKGNRDDQKSKDPDQLKANTNQQPSIPNQQATAPNQPIEQTR